MFKRIANDIRSQIIAKLLFDDNWEDGDDSGYVKVFPDDISHIFNVLIIIGATIGVFISILMILFLELIF